MSKCAVIGGGAWGSALASVLSQQGHEVKILVRRPEMATALTAGTSPRLDHQPITPPHLATTDAATALAEAEAVFVVVPVAATADALIQISTYAPVDAVVALTAKGLEAETGDLQPELAARYLGRDIVMLCGPSFADEVAAGKPCCLVAASHDTHLAQIIAQLFLSSPVRVYTSNDPIGVAVASSVKNVIAIASGITAALHLGDNARAALITRGLAETSRLALALGGRPETLFGLAGAGDMFLTCTDSHSRNYAYGLALGSGAPPSSDLAEGAKTVSSLVARASSLGVDTPIIRAIDNVINQDADITREIKTLLARPVDQEWEQNT
ncbi:MAG: NAD(P)H-dependent glycerol-3-phosphate dehydrogenase [Candidatus Puniceispirillales bacterium]